MPEPDTIFYDGACGLCHRWIRFVVPRDPGGEKFRFAPLQGPTFAGRIEERRRESLPDSIVVQRGGDDAAAALLVRSAAVLHIMKRLGGGWAVLSGLARLVPPPVRDWGYDRVASVRHRLFKKPDDACPLVPPELRDRFLP
ncbi:MAG: DCC1-like thiol-disulfide oxidoreductase family protein [Planctomycetota bacterium]